MMSKILSPEQVLWDKSFTEDVKSGRFFWITNKSVIDFERGNFKKFWQLYEKLPDDIKNLADKTFIDLKKTQEHTLLNILKVGRYWSLPIGTKNRALGVEVDEGGLLWCWIGSYSDYINYVDSINKDKE
tara:strand:+ start:152 stop:538 length:387 start_codon:yes stop_codon:yes gene_type:complete